MALFDHFAWYFTHEAILAFYLVIPIYIGFRAMSSIDAAELRGNVSTACAWLIALFICFLQYSEGTFYLVSVQRLTNSDWVNYGYGFALIWLASWIWSKIAAFSAYGIDKLIFALLAKVRRQ